MNPIQTAGILLLAGAALWGQASQSAGSRNPILDARPDARLQGLGGFGACLDRHLAAVFENPALASTLRGLCFSSTGMELFDEERLYSVSAGTALASFRGGCGIQWRQLTSERIERTEFVLDSLGNHIFDAYGNRRDTVLGFYSDITNMALIHAGAEILPSLALGIGAKGFYRLVSDTSSWYGSFDAGLYWRPAPRLRVGMTAKDVLNTAGKGLADRAAQAGVAALLFDNHLLLGGQLENLLHERFDRNGALGIEWQMAQPLLVRAGWNPNEVSAGAGIMLGSLHLNYAVLYHSHFGFHNPHRISIEYYYGGKGSI